MNNNYIVELENVDTIYEGEKIPAIRDINLEIKTGEFICVIGPNGAGKTTLLETINGILPSTQGKVRVIGQDIKKFGHSLRRRIGYVPQEIAVDELSPFLVEDVIMMGRFGKIGILKSPSLQDFEIMEEIIKWIKIEDLLRRPVGKLSGGQLQKVMIARALVKKPKILLLDEPFSNLDIKASQDISEKICHLHLNSKLTIIMVTHNIGSIPVNSNKVMLMNDGKITGDNLSPKDFQLDQLKFLYQVKG